jgi:hypothetical protein
VLDGASTHFVTEQCGWRWRVCGVE